MEGRGVKQDLIPYVGQLELANIPVKGWIIDPDEHGFFYGLSEVVHLPTNYGEVVCTEAMTRDIAMVIDGERGPEMFPEPFPINLAGSPMYSSSQSSWSHLYL